MSETEGDPDFFCLHFRSVRTKGSQTIEAREAASEICAETEIFIAADQIRRTLIADYL